MMTNSFICPHITTSVFRSLTPCLLYSVGLRQVFFPLIFFFLQLIAFLSVFVSLMFCSYSLFYLFWFFTQSIINVLASVHDKTPFARLLAGFHLVCTLRVATVVRRGWTHIHTHIGANIHLEIQLYLVVVKIGCLICT